MPQKKTEGSFKITRFLIMVSQFSFSKSNTDLQLAKSLPKG